MTFTSPDMTVRHWRRNKWFYRLEASINQAGCFMAPIGIVRFLARKMLEKRGGRDRDKNEQKKNSNGKETKGLKIENTAPENDILKELQAA